jgi:hypothetical protein
MDHPSVNLFERVLSTAVLTVKVSDFLNHSEYLYLCLPGEWWFPSQLKIHHIPPRPVSTHFHPLIVLQVDGRYANRHDCPLTPPCLKMLMFPSPFSTEIPLFLPVSLPFGTNWTEQYILYTTGSNPPLHDSRPMQQTYLFAFSMEIDSCRPFLTVPGPSANQFELRHCQASTQEFCPRAYDRSGSTLLSRRHSSVGRAAD